MQRDSANTEECDSDLNDVVTTLKNRRDQIIEKTRQIEQEISNITETYKKRLAELNREKQPLDEALIHIGALLRLEGIDEVPPTIGTNQRSTNQSVVRLTDVACEILKESGKPLHYRELVKRIQAKDIYIPGKDIGATLLSRISRDLRFKRTKKRGVYVLRTNTTVKGRKYKK